MNKTLTFDELFWLTSWHLHVIGDDTPALTFAKQNGWSAQEYKSQMREVLGGRLWPRDYKLQIRKHVFVQYHGQPENEIVVV